MIKILWLSPNFNHYKARFLNHFAKEDGIDLTLLTGVGNKTVGEIEINENWSFKQIKTTINKNKFGFSSAIRRVLFKEYNKYDWVLIPAEKKNSLLLLYLISLRFFFNKTKLISYNHPLLKSNYGKSTKLDIILTKFFYKKLDRVIFYTKESCEFAIENNFINKSKAFWANNTIDNIEISKSYDFSLPPKNKLSILFIGKLIPSKRLDILLDYFKIIDERHPGLFELNIIGDGPQQAIIKEYNLSNIFFHGSIFDEKEITPIMEKACCVFVPGLSGLSINHAFAYGRPYITLFSNFHGPEISYINDNYNGLILNSTKDDNINSILDFLLDSEKIDKFCINAYEKCVQLSVKNWVVQMCQNFKDAY